MDREMTDQEWLEARGIDLRPVSGGDGDGPGIDLGDAESSAKAHLSGGGEGDEGGTQPPPAEPPPPPPPPPPPAKDPQQPAEAPEPPPADEGPKIGDVAVSSLPEPVQKRLGDLQKENERNRKYNKRFSPYAQVFDDAPEGFLSEAETVGADLLGTTTGALAQLGADDRDKVSKMVQMLADPEKWGEAVVWFEDAAEVLRSRSDSGGPAVGVTPGADQPVSRAELQQWQAEQERRHDEERNSEAQAVQLDGVIREIRDFDDYDVDAAMAEPDSAEFDPVQRARVEALLTTAHYLEQRGEGGLAEARALIQQNEQGQTERYLEQKRQEASTPPPPGGGTPAQEPKEPETLKDADEAARNRLKAMLG